MSSPRVLIVGGGVIGCTAARRLAREGAGVEVLERGEPGAEASSAAAGMLVPQAEARQPGPFLELLRASRRMYPEFAAALGEETGIDVGYRDVGTLLLALTAEDEAELEERYAWQSAAGLPVERFSPEDARKLEPALSPELRAALRFPDDHQVDNRRLARALWFAAEAAGARFRRGAEAARLLHDGRGARGVELAGGERVEADFVVLAGGSWAGKLRDLPRPLPVSPVHGQLVSLDTSPPLLRHLLDSPRGYLVPRADGRLIVGATAEETGFAKAVTPRGVLGLLQAALEMVPSLADRPIAELWSGLRPGSPDALPILGPDPDLANLLYATGHFRNGILLAPITAEIIAAEVLGRTPPADPAPFGIGRFEAR